MNLADYPDVGRVVECAAVTQLNVKTVYAAIERGELSAVRCGRAIRVTKVALLRWLGLDDDVGPTGREEGPGGEIRALPEKSGQDSSPSLSRSSQ